MSGMTPDDERLLDVARGGHEPTDANRKRVRAAVLGTLGVGAGLGVTTATSAAAGASLVVKALATVAVVTAVAGGGWAAVRVTRSAGPVASEGRAAHAGETIAAAPRSRPAPELAAPVSALPSVVATAPPTAPSASSPALPNAARSRGRVPLNPSEARPVAVVPAVPVAAADVARPAPATALEGETKLVSGGVAALHAGDPSRALALFDDHALTYPHGVLAEERSGERVLALCAVGRAAEARAAASQFLLAWPRSPLAARVRASCADTPNP